jgi:hypothetical protein
MTKNNLKITREQWLLQAIDQLRSTLFLENQAQVPELRVSVGFPGGGSKYKAIGEYWPKKSVSDGIPQVFISPVLDEPIRCLDVLVHELVHACTPGSGHKGPFRVLALAVGLEGKMTATTAGPKLRERLNALATSLGQFPQSKINLSDRKKQGTRLGKIECQSCGYTCRVTKKWIETMGAPICPCNKKPMAVIEKDEE